jgi:hypothetical protein
MWQFGCQNGICSWQMAKVSRNDTFFTGALQPTSQPHVLVPVEAPAVCTPGGWRPAGDLGNVRWSWPDRLWTQATKPGKNT